jgi:hypothetical protein
MARPVVLVVLLVGEVPLAYGQTRIVPVISATEQYDTNVFFTPKSQLEPGVQPEDFITTVIPQVVGTYTGRSVDGNVSVGALVTHYVNNPNLDYLGFNASGAINLARVVQKSLPRLTTWSVTGAYQYTPSFAPFGGAGSGYGGAGFGGSGGSGGGAQPEGPGPFEVGLVTQRVRTESVSLGTTATYALAPTTLFRASLSYNTIGFGSQFQQNPQAQNSLFNTSSLSIGAGVSTRLSATDIVDATYSPGSFSQQNANNFKTHAGSVTWSKLWSRELRSTLRGGVTLLEPYTNTSSGTPQRVPAFLLPTGTASMTYASGSSFIRAAGAEGGLFGSLPTLAGTLAPGGTAGRGAYSVSLGYNIGVSPAFVGISGALLSQVVSLSGTVGLTDRLTAQGGANLGYSKQAAETAGTTFISYGTTVNFNYSFTPTLRASLAHNWLSFDQSSAAAGDVSFSKQTVLLSLSYAFGGHGDFFRTGAFWTPSISKPAEEPEPAAPEKSDTGASGINK